MNLIDSSAWIDYLQGADTRARTEVRDLLGAREALATSEPVVMELLAGAPNERALTQLQLLTGSLVMLGIEPNLDYVDAATIHRTVRRSGRTVRRLNDCVIAAVAMRHGATLVHKDMDFEVIGECVPLDALSLR